MTTTRSLGLLLSEVGRSRLESATIEVKEGLRRHWARASPPMKSVHPVRINFMIGFAIG